MERTLTSASNFSRRVKCKGSPRIEKGLKDVPTPYAERGRMLHDLWANPARSRAQLSDEDLTNLEAVETADKKFHDWVFGAGAPVITMTETPVTLFAGTPHEMRSTPDRVYWCPDTAVVAVPDAKFGRLEVDDAADNWQLAVYLCSLADQYPDAERFFGIILQPWAKVSAPVEFSRAEVQAMVAQILQILIESSLPDAPLSPSVDACRFCKGALHGVCPAHRGAALAPVKDPVAVARAIADPVTFLMSIQPDQRAQLLDALTLADNLNAVIRPAARELLAQDKDAIPGYVKKKDTETRKITDVRGLIAYLELTGKLDRSEITAACQMPISGAERLLKKATGLKGEAFAKESERVLKKFVDITPRAGNLERV